ncbi:hypothetical protein F7D01_05620 [Erythrobacter sp. 3-20A1M]|uniref:hypothetical protein n=1 Tax=Erythrobacter sp. 3-20A1M TaxID=2653850 RepID=UPI001BFCC0C3|nr:hypothetical protein [Erythrobacter sp. 3-20A1M]QWC56641.1 hypothetical protein F7D01_05620 [Erythrobacter sp. 3-20A1M]
MRITILTAAALALVPAMALARPADMNADTFYVASVELLGKGMGALLDKRTKPMMAAMKDAGAAVKAENDAAAKAGRPLYCVPESAKKKGVGPRFVVDRLGAIPQQRRRALTLRQAWREILVREYPCS